MVEQQQKYENDLYFNNRLIKKPFYFNKKFKHLALSDLEFFQKETVEYIVWP